MPPCQGGSREFESRLPLQKRTPCWDTACRVPTLLHRHSFVDSDTTTLRNTGTTFCHLYSSSQVFCLDNTIPCNRVFPDRPYTTAANYFAWHSRAAILDYRFTHFP